MSTVEEVTGPTGTTGTVEEVTGHTGTTGTVEEVTGPTSGIFDLSGIAIQPTPPPPIRLEDILSSVEVLSGKEAGDKSLLDSIESISYDILKPRLIQWAVSGFRNAYPIYEIPMTAPPLCSDGETRNLYDYIQFVSGKTIGDHVAALQTRLADMTVSFAYTGSSILIVVSKSG